MLLHLHAAIPGLGKPRRPKGLTARHVVVAQCDPVCTTRHTVTKLAGLAEGFRSVLVGCISSFLFMKLINMATSQSLSQRKGEIWQPAFRIAATKTLPCWPPLSEGGFICMEDGS